MGASNTALTLATSLSYRILSGCAGTSTPELWVMQKPGIDQRRMLGIRIKYLWVYYAGFKSLFGTDVILEECKPELEANSCTKN